MNIRFLIPHLVFEQKFYFHISPAHIARKLKEQDTPDDNNRSKPRLNREDFAYHQSNPIISQMRKWWSIKLNFFYPNSHDYLSGNNNIFYTQPNKK